MEEGVHKDKSALGLGNHKVVLIWPKSRVSHSNLLSPHNKLNGPCFLTELILKIEISHYYW
jgi:hypothetical protein